MSDKFGALATGVIIYPNVEIPIFCESIDEVFESEVLAVLISTDAIENRCRKLAELFAMVNYTPNASAFWQLLEINKKNLAHSFAILNIDVPKSDVQELLFVFERWQSMLKLEMEAQSVTNRVATVLH